MRKSIVTMCSALLLFAVLSSFIDSDSKEKYNNPAAEKNLAKRVYDDIKLGRTDSLFLHLSAIYQLAGWKNYVPYYEQERAPKLYQQDYRVPFSKCSADEITQSRLMDSLSQGWKYWQMWSDSLTNSTWKPSASIKDQSEAYLLGNYTILVIMSHELGHFYANGNGAYENADGMHENVADHFAMAMLLDLAKADKRLEKLLTRFRKVFINDIYNSVPEQNRSVLQDGYTLYEHAYFFRMNFGFKEYASMQLLREKIILDLPGLNLRSCLFIYKRGLQEVIFGNKVRMYTDGFDVHNFCNDSLRLGADKIKAMNNALLGYPRMTLGVYPDGELYAYRFADTVIQLKSLTTSWPEQNIRVAPLKHQLDSIAGFDICSSSNKYRFSFVFEDTSSFSMYILTKYRDGIQHVCCVELSNGKTLRIQEARYLEAKMDTAQTSINFASRSSKGPVFVGYNSEDKQIILQSDAKGKFLASEYKQERSFDETPDLGADQAVAETSGYNFGIDSLGNQLIVRSGNSKYRKDHILYSVNVICGTETRGTPTGLDKDRLLVWSPKYGFVGKQEGAKCVVGVRFK